VIWSVRLVPDAEADLERLATFLAAKSPLAAARVGEAIVSAIRSLATYPFLGRQVGNDGRRELIIPFGRSAYILRYLVEAEEVIVVRIFHGLEDRPS